MVWGASGSLVNDSRHAGSLIQGMMGVSMELIVTKTTAYEAKKLPMDP